MVAKENNGKGRTMKKGHRIEVWVGAFHRATGEHPALAAGPQPGDCWLPARYEGKVGHAIHVRPDCSRLLKLVYPEHVREPLTP